MPEAIYRTPGDEIHVAAAAADYDCGDIVQVGGLAGVVEGVSGVLTGEAFNARIKGGYDVACASGTTFSEGATVEFNNTTKLAVASGDFVLGKAARAKVSGQTVVRVQLNE